MTPGGLVKSLMAQRTVPADNLLLVAFFPPFRCRDRRGRARAFCCVDCHSLTFASFRVIWLDICQHEHGGFKFTHFCLVAFAEAEYEQHSSSGRKVKDEKWYRVPLSQGRLEAGKGLGETQQALWKSWVRFMESPAERPHDKSSGHRCRYLYVQFEGECRTSCLHRKYETWLTATNLTYTPFLTLLFTCVYSLETSRIFSVVG